MNCISLTLGWGRFQGKTCILHLAIMQNECKEANDPPWSVLSLLASFAPPEALRFVTKLARVAPEKYGNGVYNS
jgi:hypothetical protein